MFYEDLIKTIEGYKDCLDEKHFLKRITWEEMFLGIAFLVSKRSHDAQTQCGAVIVDNKDIIATGYNGFIRNTNDQILPNLRPKKYPFMIHAEHNAILACARNNKSCSGSTIYITGDPCTQCFQFINQAGIKQIIHGHNPTHMASSNTDPDGLILREYSDVMIKKVDFNPKEFFTEIADLF